MNKEQLQQEYQEGRRDFTHLNLSGLDLTRINLAGANLTGSNLNGSILISARLADANFTEVSLENSNLKWASLANANLTKANLTKTNLHRANLQGSNLTAANLTKTNLKSASLGNANLTGANLTKTNLESASLENANLAEANLTKTNLKNISLNKAILKNANLTGADLTNANLEESDLTDANLINSKVDGVYWLGCKLYDLGVLPDQEALVWQIHNIGVQNLDLSGKNLSNANLYKANLAGMDLTETDLSGTNLECANLAGVDLTGTDLSGTNLECANLTAANLTRANLSGTSLKRANLTAANLTNANLTNVRLKYVNFRRANLQGIQFEGTSFFSADLIDAINLPSPILSPLFVPDNHPDADLVYSLRSFTEGLTCTSEAEYPYDIFLWDAAIREEFTLEKFLKEIGYLKLTNLQILQSFDSETEEITRYYQVLLDKIKAELFNLEIYQFETKDIIEYCPKSARSYIIMGRTVVGDWFGAIITDDFGIYTGTSRNIGGKVTEMSEIFGKDDKAIEKAEHINLISAVKEAGTEIENLFWSLAEERDLMLHKLLVAADIFAIRGVEYCSYVTDEDLYEDYEEDDMKEKEKLEYEKKKEFSQLVLNNLSNILVYFIGVVDIDLYLVGETKNKDWLGIHTGVVWT